MEPQPISETGDFSSTVDTSRPFSSVREAVAIFGDRLLLGDFYSSPKPFSDAAVRLSSPLPPSPVKSVPPNNNEGEQERENSGVLDTLKKLEEELEKTKAELKLLKERGSETEVALATLNAELHKNMSKLAQAEAAAAGKAAASSSTKTVRFEMENHVDEIKEARMKKESSSKTLAQILSLGENDYLLYGRKQRKQSMRQKPIIPLVGDLFFKKKASSTNHHNPLYASPF